MPHDQKQVRLEQAKLDVSPPLVPSSPATPERDPNLDLLSRAQRASLEIDTPTPAPAAPAPEVNAQALLQAIAQAKSTQVRELRVKDDKEYMYFYGCRRGHVAIWFRGNPDGVHVTPKEWFATYKRIEEPWTGYVWCQECYKPDAEGYPQGEEQGIQVEYSPQGGRRPTVFATRPRFLFKIARDPERAAREQAIRVADGVSLANPKGDRRARMPQVTNG